MITSLDFLYIVIGLAVALLAVTITWAIVNFVKTTNKFRGTIDEINTQLGVTRDIVESIREPIREFRNFAENILKPLSNIGNTLKNLTDFLSADDYPSETSQDDNDSDIEE